MKLHPIVFVSKLVFVLVGGLVFTGCSSAMKVDSGPIKASTFNFVQNKASDSVSAESTRKAIHGMIQDSITSNLASKGLTRVNSGGQVTVAYLVVVGNNVSTATIDDYFGYGRDASGIGDKVHKSQTDSGNPNFFEAGTLVIDVIDSKTFKLLNRVSVVKPGLKTAPAEVRKENIQQAVNEALGNLQVAR